MTYVRTFISIAVLTSAALATSAWAGDQNASHHPAPDTVAQVAQMRSGSPRAGATARDYASQMKAMQQMHDEMLAAKTPKERRALMPKQMKLMQGG
ncbi:MAG: hypothetical protein EPN62_13065, partial [Candidimonas sp.]